MTLLILFIILSIGFSFLCSILEAVLLSVTPSFINRKVQEGSQVGLDFQQFKLDIDRPLSAILTLNTIAHTVGAIGVGAQAAVIYKDQDVMGISYESIVAALMTLAVLILSEIIPKTLGANYWRALSGPTAKVLKVMILILSPFVWLSQLITKSMKKKEVGSVFSRADIVAMARVSQDSGELKESESKVISNLMSLDKLTVHDIMTPRSVMEMISEEDSLQSYYDSRENFKFSRIPLYQEKTDNITGFFLKDDLLDALIKGQGDKPLSSIKREVSMVHEDKILHELLDQLSNQRDHLAIAIDDYGSVVGLVTMEDILETVLGFEIVDESDTVSDLQDYARKKWQERAKKIGIIE